MNTASIITLIVFIAVIALSVLAALFVKPRVKKTVTIDEMSESGELVLSEHAEMAFSRAHMGQGYLTMEAKEDVRTANCVLVEWAAGKAKYRAFSVTFGADRIASIALRPDTRQVALYVTKVNGIANGISPLASPLVWEIVYSALVAAIGIIGGILVWNYYSPMVNVTTDYTMPMIWALLCLIAAIVGIVTPIVVRIIQGKRN